jgi:hypothetical protein
MSETALAIAKDYPQDKFNLLIPVKTMQELSPLHKLVINEVQIDSAKESKDTYPQNGELALTKKALMKLMAAANIQIIDSHTIPTQRCNKCIEIARVTRLAPKCSDCSYIDDIAVQVTIAVPEPSGTYRMIRATKEIRMDDEKPKYTSDKAFAQFKQFKTEHCESKALNRALREGLMIKSTYTLQELKKPFAVALVMPNMADPDLKKAMVERYANNAASLYGGQVAQLPIGQTMDALPPAMTVIPPDDDEYDPETGEVNPGLEVIDVIIDPEPEPEPPVMIGCEGEDCGGILEPFEDASHKQWDPDEWAVKTKELTGRKLCVACFIKWQKEQKAAKEAEKAEKAKKDKAGGK